MNYFYIAFPLVVWIISQTIKFFIRLVKKDIPVNIKGAFWVYAWAGGTPSTHTAMLTSALVLVWHQFGFSPIFAFCLVIVVMWLYDMATQRKREELMDNYYLKDPSLTNVVTDGFMLDLAGHTVREIFWGAVLGISLGSLFSVLVI